MFTVKKIIISTCQIGFDLYVCFIILIFSAVCILLQIYSYCENNSKDYLYIV